MVLTHNHSIGTNWIFAHWLIMVRSRNWPDLWWQISKIRDIQVVQTEASRRRREAEVQQAMGKRAWVMYVCMYVCMYICMFFTYISQFTAHTEFKSVPFASPLNATLLRNEFSWVRYPTSAWHVKIAKKSTKIPEWRKIMWKLAAEHSQFWRYQ